METNERETNEPAADGRGFGAWWNRTPLYLRIVGALVLGVIVGVILGPKAVGLAGPSKLILRLLGALAPPLILIAVVQALLTTDIKGKQAGRLAGLLLLNTTVAICIGLLVANVVRPGRIAHITPPTPKTAETKAADAPRDALTQFLDSIPTSLVKPLADNNVIGVIIIALAFGLALRPARHTPIRTLEDVVKVAFDALLHVLHWVLAVVPLGVFGIVASIIGGQGFALFVSLGAFIFAVVLALFLQATYYLTRIRLGSWVRPAYLLRNTRDALVTAFSTDSSTATMPLNYECLRERVGLRQESASLGALVGSNFNNDGTALYEAMSALFISQLIGRNLDIKQQFLVVLTSIVASVGAAGIPEAGLVTMTLVFGAVGLPIEYIGILLTVDWFLDRCRTTINVMGDMNVACLLDGKTREAATPQIVSITSSTEPVTL